MCKVHCTGRGTAFRVEGAILSIRVKCIEFLNTLGKQWRGMPSVIVLGNFRATYCNSSKHAFVCVDQILRLQHSLSSKMVTVW